MVEVGDWKDFILYYCTISWESFFHLECLEEVYSTAKPSKLSLILDKPEISCMH